jgi:hypothetical protein
MKKLEAQKGLKVLKLKRETLVFLESSDLGYVNGATNPQSQSRCVTVMVCCYLY